MQQSSHWLQWDAPYPPTKLPLPVRQLPTQLSASSLESTDPSPQMKSRSAIFPQCTKQSNRQMVQATKPVWYQHPPTLLMTAMQLITNASEAQSSAFCSEEWNCPKSPFVVWHLLASTRQCGHYLYVDLVRSMANVIHTATYTQNMPHTSRYYTLSFCNYFSTVQCHDRQNIEMNYPKCRK